LHSVTPVQLFVINAQHTHTHTHTHTHGLTHRTVGKSRAHCSPARHQQQAQGVHGAQHTVRASRPHSAAPSIIAMNKNSHPHARDQPPLRDTRQDALHGLARLRHVQCPTQCRYCDCMDHPLTAAAAAQQAKIQSAALGLVERPSVKMER